jgi:hypothetical protein
MFEHQKRPLWKVPGLVAVIALIFGILAGLNWPRNTTAEQRLVELIETRNAQIAKARKWAGEAAATQKTIEGICKTLGLAVAQPAKRPEIDQGEKE